MFASWAVVDTCGMGTSVVFLQLGFVLDLVVSLLLWVG